MSSNSLLDYFGYIEQTRDCVLFIFLVQSLFDLPKPNNCLQVSHFNFFFGIFQKKAVINQLCVFLLHCTFECYRRMHLTMANTSRQCPKILSPTSIDFKTYFKLQNLIRRPKPKFGHELTCSYSFTSTFVIRALGQYTGFYASTRLPSGHQPLGQADCNTVLSRRFCPRCRLSFG